MRNDAWIDRLSEYLDGDLAEAERQALEAHLGVCEDCAATLEELRAVVARAGSLDDRPPVRDLWDGIGERIGAHPAVRPIDSAPRVRRAMLTRRFSVSMPQLAAAAAALIVLSGAAVAGLLSYRARPAEIPLAGQDRAKADLIMAATFGGAKYDSTVAELEHALAQNRSRLDTTTVRIVEQNLAIIDRAIDQARRALASDPGSTYLNDHLAGTLKRKVELLLRVTALTAVQS